MSKHFGFSLAWFVWALWTATAFGGDALPELLPNAVAGQAKAREALAKSLRHSAPSSPRRGERTAAEMSLAVSAPHGESR